MLRGGRLAQLSQLATASYIALALWLTLRQHDFAYADENEMASSDCGLLVTNRSALVVTSYLRTAEELRRICGVPRVVSARNARVYGPDDIAPMVALLASPHSGWITGQVLSISGGFSMV